MALDPNIILQARGVQIDSPLDTYARVAQVQAARNQNRIADIAFQDRSRAQAADSSLAQLLASGKTGDEIVSGLAGGGFGSQALAYQKTAQEQKKAAAELKKAEADAQETQVKAAKTSFDSIASTLGALQAVPGGANPMMIQRALGHLSDIGVIKPEMVDKVLASAPQDPAQLPAWLEQQRNAAMSAKEQVAARQQEQVFGETKRSNMAREANSAGQLAVSRGTLGVAQQRLSFDRQQPRGQIIQSELGTMLVDPRTGEAKPVTLNGSPMSTSGKMTEDQGKATGWLIQAENAYGNMLKAIDPKGGTPSASKPGVNDAIAQIPLIGEAIGNNFRSADRQKFLQGASSLSEALLRAATGAGVNRDEAIQKVREITPVSGDTDANIAQKMEAIPLYLDSLKVRAGPGAKKAAVVIDNSRAKKSQSNIFDEADAILGGK